MSMPDISLDVIDPRIALASIVASIALQEAAVSHVLNAEGEKIQAVVGLTGATVADLQNINLSVGETVDNIAVFNDDLQSKLQTALQALFPLADLIIHFVDSLTGLPVNCQCLHCTLTDDATGVGTELYARRDMLPLANLKPGSYTLSMIDACPGYAHNENVFDIHVDAKGNVTFNGAPVTNESPAVIEMDESTFRLAAPAPATPPPAPVQRAAPKPVAPSPAPVQKALSKPAAAPPAPTQEPVPVPKANSQYIVYTLIDNTTGVTSTFYEKDYAGTLASLKTGSYTLRMVDVGAGSAQQENVFGIDVDAAGNVMFKAPRL